MDKFTSIPGGLSDAAREPEKQSGRATKRARKKSNPERMVAELVCRRDDALSYICRAAWLGAEAAGKKAAAALSNNDCRRDWYIRERACHAVAYEKYFEILDSVVRAAGLAAARAAGFRTLDALIKARCTTT